MRALCLAIVSEGNIIREVIMSRQFLLLAGLYIVSLSDILAQTERGAIPDEAKERLDHIVGKWEFRTDYLDRNGGVRRSIEGVEEAEYAIDGRVVELTTVVNGSVSKGWLFYDIAQESFRLVSVDGQGNLWNFSGGLDAYVITSQPRRQANGRELTLRFTHSEITEDSFVAVMETSIDGGASWRTQSKQYLTRKETLN